ncbi:MAG: tRNA (adenosine(37)-N6)-threonylcarbamoyltransferase complex ATPase subunit type 1 TsaE [bacterium]|nr:tRNA (adenosine(37)-N6)-threonylcarbamoyltransferase complex ATPase subunit type 1 TsaE [bacterium]
MKGEYITKSKDEMWVLAEKFVKDFRDKDTVLPHIFALSGDLGSGKTSFVQGVVKAFGISDRVISPTFVLERRYKIPENFSGESEKSESGKFANPFFKNLIHIDAYRLSGEGDMKALNFAETCANTENLIFIEWPEIISNSKLGGVLENFAKKDQIAEIKFEHIDENTRRVIFL